MRNRSFLAVILVVCLLLICAFCFLLWHTESEIPANDSIPVYDSKPFSIINGNNPSFTDSEKRKDSFEFYSELDALNRCGFAFACIGPELMPTEERGSIGQIKPSGWQTVKYDFIDGKYLYNRCHLIGYQLTGENANPQNLITGTRYLNMEGMLPIENYVSDYIKETGNHVLYRVTPDFRNQEMLARGVKIEGWSVEDGGTGVCFCIYAYNVQPGVHIDYVTGESEKADAQQTTVTHLNSYILNTASKRFHMEDCSQGKTIKKENRDIYYGNCVWLLIQGYTPAGCCDPK